MTFFKKHSLFLAFMASLIMGIVLRATRYEWLDVFTVFLYPFVVLFLWYNILRGILVCFILFVKEKKWKALIASVLCVGVLFLPLTQWYETIRFQVLKNNMETVANQIAEEYQDTLINKPLISGIPLPKDKKFLSRNGGTITCFVTSGKIEVSFCSNSGFFSDDCYFIYTTDYNCCTNANEYDYYNHLIKAIHMANGWKYCFFYLI